LTLVKYASPWLNSLRCDCHQFNLASCHYREFHGAGTAKSKNSLPCGVIPLIYLQFALFHPALLAH